MSDNIRKVDPESHTSREKKLSYKKKVAIGSAVAAGAIITGAVLYGSGVFSSKKPNVSSSHSDSDALEALVANIPPAGKLEDKDVQKLTAAFDKMILKDQIKNFKNPKVAQAVLSNKIPLKVTNMDAKQKQELEKDLIKIQNDPNTPDELKKAAKELQETITEVKVFPLRQKPPPGGGGDEVVGDKGNNSGTGVSLPKENPIKEGGELDQGEGKQEDSGKGVGKSTKEEGEPDKKSENDQKKNDASKKRAEVASLLAKPFNGPKEVSELLSELNKGTLVKPDGAKYVLDDIKNRCSIEPFIRPLLEATDLKALPKLDDISTTIASVQKELKEVSDVTVKSYFQAFDHADDKSTLVAHLNKDLENLKGDILAARFALLQSIDPVTFNDEYAKNTLLKKSLNMSSEDLAITFMDDLDQLNDYKALIALIDKTKDVDKMITDAKSELKKMNNALQVLVKYKSLEPTEAKMALELAAKTNKAVEEEIKKSCKVEALIGNMMMYDGSQMTPLFFDKEKELVKEMRAKVSALSDADASKPLYESFLKSETGALFKNEAEAIEACLVKDIETQIGGILLGRYILLNMLNKDKYDAYFADITILKRALEKSPADLAKVPDFRNFLTQRKLLINYLSLTGPVTLEDVIFNAEVSGLNNFNQDMVKWVLLCIKDMRGITANDFDTLKKLLTNNKDLKLFDHKGEQLTLVNLAEKCSQNILVLMENVESFRGKLLKCTGMDEDVMKLLVESFVKSIGNLKSSFDLGHEDIQKHYGFDATIDIKTREENILAKDASKLKGDRLFCRYFILNEINDATYNVDFAKNTLIGNFTKADLKSDPVKLADLYDKRKLCHFVNYRIDGDDIVTVLNEVTDEMKTQVDLAPDKQKLLRDDPKLLTAALRGLLGPMALELEELESSDQYVTKNLDALLGDMADRKELVKIGIALQRAINKCEPRPGEAAPNAASKLSFVKALADYLKCTDFNKFPVQKVADGAPYEFNQLVGRVKGSAEISALFSAFIEYDDASFERVMSENNIREFIKDAVHTQITSDINSLSYTIDFDKSVELLKRIKMKKGSNNVAGKREAEVSEAIAKRYKYYFKRALKDRDNIKNFDDRKLKNANAICQSLSIKMADPVFSKKVVLIPLLTYLGDPALKIDFTANSFDEHMPVKTFLNFLKTNGELSWQAYNAVLSRTPTPNFASFLLHKLLVPTFDLLPSIDFYDYEKILDKDVKLFHGSLLDLGPIDDDDKKDLKIACLKALTNDSNPNKIQNILYLWGSSKKAYFDEQKRKQLESLKLVNASNEIILRARDRLLETKEAKADNDVKALYKTHYEALKQLYTGSDREAKFPNNW